MAKGLLVGFQPKADEPLAQRRSFASLQAEEPIALRSLSAMEMFNRDQSQGNCSEADGLLDVSPTSFTTEDMES